MSRLMDCTGGVFDIEILDGPRLVTYPKPKTGESAAIWTANVRLTIPGLGSRSNVGTAMCLNEDSPKSAVTDGIKKAATLFGVGLQLYAKAERAQQPQSQAAGRAPRQPAPAAAAMAARSGKPPINESGAICPLCHAPDGKAHAKTCPSLS